MLERRRLVVGHDDEPDVRRHFDGRRRGTTPHAGQCRNTSPDRLESFPGRPVAHGVRARDWVDETPVVDCSKPHTLETVEVVTLAEKPTLTLVKQLAGSCPSAAALSYLGITFPAFRTLRGVAEPPRTCGLREADG